MIDYRGMYHALLYGVEMAIQALNVDEAEAARADLLRAEAQATNLYYETDIEESEEPEEENRQMAALHALESLCVNLSKLTDDEKVQFGRLVKEQLLHLEKDDAT